MRFAAPAGRGAAGFGGAGARSDGRWVGNWGSATGRRTWRDAKARGHPNPQLFPRRMRALGAFQSERRGDLPRGAGRGLLAGMAGAREVFFLIGKGGAVLWSDASHSPSALPDSRARWEAIWSRRETLVEVAHSHPVGPSRFSREDETTMAALTGALGRPLIFSVVSPSGMVRRAEDGDDVDVAEEPWWAALMRAASHMEVGT